MKITELQATNPILYYTDKFGTAPIRWIHSYGEYYDKLFENIKDKNLNILEIGMERGGSVRLWHDYFINSQIYAIDVWNRWKAGNIENYPRLHMYFFDAYINDNVFNNIDVKFDIIIDDGPHTINSQIYFINNMSRLLKDDGILILEDVLIYNLDKLTSIIKSEYQIHNWVRPLSARDDIIIEIKK